MKTEYFSINGIKLDGKPESGEYLERVKIVKGIAARHVKDPTNMNYDWYYCGYYPYCNKIPNCKRNYTVYGGKLHYSDEWTPTRVKLDSVSFEVDEK